MPIPGVTSNFDLAAWLSNQKEGTKVTLTTLSGGCSIVTVEGSYEARKRSRFDEPNGGRPQSEESTEMRGMSTESRRELEAQAASRQAQGTPCDLYCAGHCYGH
jgi:hypothetical protein